MGQALKIIVVVAICHFGAYFVLARLTPHGEKLRQYLIASILIVASAVITRSALLGYLVTVLVCYYYTKGADNSERIALFFGLAFTMSYSDGFALNPGLNLGGLSHHKILILSILVPMFYLRKAEADIRRFHTIDKAVVCFFIWWLMLSVRGYELSGILRTLLWTSVEYVVPYLVIRRFLSNYSLVFAAISFALMSQALTGFFEAFLRWHVHTDIEALANFHHRVMAMYKLRWGFLRAQASFLNPLIFVLFANMAFLSAYIYFKKTGIDKPPKTYSKFWALAGLGVGLAGTLSTGSRAGIAGSFLIVLIMTALLWAIKKKTDPKLKLVAMGLTALLLVFTFGSDYIRENFDYRWRLFEVSSQVILAEPIVGQANPTADPRMSSLVQGEGIVDLVNTYISIALHYGLVGLALFVYIIFGGLSRLYDNLRRTEGEKLMFGVFCFASLLLLAFNIATTSTFGWSYLWIWLLLAISSNIIARVESENKTQTTLL